MISYTMDKIGQDEVPPSPSPPNWTRQDLSPHPPTPTTQIGQDTSPANWTQEPPQIGQDKTFHRTTTPQIGQDKASQRTPIPQVGQDKTYRTRMFKRMR